MKIIISPAKKLNFDKEEYLIPSTEIEFATEAEKLIKKLKKLKPKAIADLMSLSPALAQLNYERYQSWNLPFDSEETKAAGFAFDDEVYSGLDIRNYSAEDLEYAQDHLMTTILAQEMATEMVALHKHLAGEEAKCLEMH